MEDVITPETLPDAVDVAAADGGGADESIPLNALKEVLGKDFKSSDAALKSIKDTYSYVGDVGKVKHVITEAKQRLGTDEQGVLQALNKLMEEPISVEAQPQAPAGLTAEQVEALISRKTEEATFFAKNESLGDIKDVLKTLKDTSESTRDMSWSDFIATDTAKKIVEPVIGYKEVQAKKSVLESNPRLGVATDKLSEARKLTQESRTVESSGDLYQARQMQNAARSNAVASVIEAFDMK